MRGVKFEELHSYDDFELYMSERPEIGTPEAKIITVDIPGSDGFVDLTETISGEVKYNNRELVFHFVSMAGISSQAAAYQKVYNALHGKKMKITLDEDPEYYYVGRCSVEAEAENTVMYVTVTADCEPYKYEQDMRVYTVDLANAGTKTVEITAGKNVSKQDWNTDYRFGTQNIPTYDFGIYQKLEVVWEPSGSMPVTVQFIDGDGTVYNKTATQDTGKVTLTATELTEAGVDMSTIWRVLASMGGNAKIYGETFHCATLEIAGTPKSAVPAFEVTGDTVLLDFNGTRYELQKGFVYSPEIVIRDGTNTMMFTGTDGTVSVEFRGGYL